MNNDDAFYKLVRESPVKDRELAQRFDMSIPSVTRWRSGRNAPHPLVRRHVINFLERASMKEATKPP